MDGRHDFVFSSTKTAHFMDGRLKLNFSSTKIAENVDGSVKRAWRSVCSLVNLFSNHNLQTAVRTRPEPADLKHPTSTS